jgi:preprotein translocase subunit SecA
MSDPLGISQAALPQAIFFAERTPPREKTLDRIMVDLQSRVLTPFARFRARRLGRIVAQIGAHAARLKGLDDDALRALAREVRFSLRRHAKPRTEDVALSFALIREAAGRILGKPHYDVQLIGGYALLRGMIAEMNTGEGKTLTVTLASITAAFCGMPVHIVTVNDYLAQRDEEELGPLYAFFGVSTGCVVEGMSRDERRAAYANDVTYCTNKELAFDYLRDILALGRRRGHLRFKIGALTGSHDATSSVVLRGLHFAIVDEADSVLVDEARTPLILSQEALAEGQAELYRQALENARALTVGRDYVIWGDDRSIELTSGAIEQLRKLADILGGAWRNRVHREELIVQALTALHLMRRDEHYILRDGKVQIIDEYTGRIMADRFWTDGLHQMIELKEGCGMSGTRLTLARMTYQRFFRRYRRLSGLSGTAREIGAELWCVYRLAIAQIPPNRPSRRKNIPAIVARNLETKWPLMVAKAREFSARGVPVLIGTRSVATSELASRHLAAANLPHVVLNAAHDKAEAEIVAAAGRPGQITVATNMAGRGTDIRLSEHAVANGGLHVIMLEAHDARRVDRQLAGRCSRQGEPGTFLPILSLQDALLDETLSRFEKKWLRVGYGLYGERFARWAMRRAQRKAERLHARMRRGLLRSDEVLDHALAFSGNTE